MKATDVIERYSYSFYLIKKVKGISCTCTNNISKEADPNCKRCLGLGTKIKIYKVKGASRETKEYEATKSENTSATPKIFYILGNQYVNKDDVIVDSENVYKVYTMQHHRGEQGKQEFTRCVCPNNKYNKILFLKNFKELLNEYKLRKK